MKIKYFLPLVAVALTSCIKEPTACFETSTSTVEIFQPVKLNNCSENAESYEWSIEETSVSLFSFGSVKETSAESPSQVWNYPGTYDVSLTAYSKKEKKKDEVSETVTVVDVCYTCEYSYVDYYGSIYEYDTEVCGSSYMDQNTFKKAIDDFEDEGYICTKN